MGVRTKSSDSTCRGELVWVLQLNLQIQPVEDLVVALMPTLLYRLSLKI
jgi:hypothetical protein